MPTPPPPVPSKWMSLAAAMAERERLRAAGRTVVLTNGVFDLLHPGHRHALAAARALGDHLFVALNSDASTRALKGPDRPVQSLAIRAAALAALDEVHAVFAFETPRLDAEIRALAPDVYSKSGDYTPATLHPAERDALAAVGARVVIGPYLPGHSTTAQIRDGRLSRRDSGDGT